MTPSAATTERQEKSMPLPCPQPKRAPSFRLVAKLKYGFQSQMASPPGMPNRPKIQCLVQRSSAQPPMAIAKKTTYRVRGTVAFIRGSATFELLSALDAQRGVRNRLQPHLADRIVALFALSVDAILDLFEGAFDRIQRSLFGLHQAEREFLLVVVAANVGHVDWHARQIAIRLRASLLQGGVGHGRNVAAQPCADGQEQLLVFL